MLYEMQAKRIKKRSDADFCCCKQKCKMNQFEQFDFTKFFVKFQNYMFKIFSPSKHKVRKTIGLFRWLEKKKQIG